MATGIFRHESVALNVGDFAKGVGGRNGKEGRGQNRGRGRVEFGRLSKTDESLVEEAYSKIL